MEDLQPRPYKLPKGLSARLQLTHLGKILFNLQFIPLVVIIASVLSFFVVAMFYLLLLMISIGTLGLIYIVFPNMLNWWAGGESLLALTEWLALCVPYIAPAGIALSVLSIVLLCFDFREKQIARIIISVIVAIITAIALAFYLNAGGVA